MIPDFQINATPGAQALQTASDAWRLEIPAGPGGRYRLAQIDDYRGLERGRFPHTTGRSLSLQARVSPTATPPGTWGFGLWNDPFSLSLGLGGGTRRFPALPNAAWFFVASSENYLSFRDDLPASGALAATFRARRWPPALLALGAFFVPLLFIRPATRWFRRLARRFIRQDAQELEIRAEQWYDYKIEWREEQARFYLGDACVLDTPVSPQGPLGLVLWIDNQYAALPPNGRLGYGTLANSQAAVLEIQKIKID